VVPDCHNLRSVCYDPPGMKSRSKTFACAVAMACAVVALPATEHEQIRVEPTALLVRNAETGGWEEQPALRDLTGNNTYITSADVDPTVGRIIVSTTFHGLYESRDFGTTWRDLGETSEIDALYLGEGFYEDIAAVAYDREDRSILWVELAQDGTVVAVDRDTGARVRADAESGRAALRQARRTAPTGQTRLDAEAVARRELAADHTSFYLSPAQMGPERLDRHMAFAREHGFTAVVVDFKDDNGRLVYDSALEPHTEMGAVRSFFSARRVIDTVHDHGLYLIARIVVFKDQQLYGYDDNRYALWDTRRDAPWGVFRTTEDEETETPVTTQVEYWVDPFSEFVWDYNIAVATELEALGVDEIQFDYIRTPADGRTADIEYRFHRDSPAMGNEDPFRDDRVEALSAFLRRARAAISTPISIDVFGFNGWYRMSYLGQDIQLLSRYVDVVSPMLYPSHFPRGFIGDAPYLEWAERLYNEGVARGRRITADNVLIRPYIQAFLIGGELAFERPTYTDYLKRQIRGARAGGGSGFTLWNNSGRYYMVADGLWFPGESPQ
jgi:hypothetical protein